MNIPETPLLPQIYDPSITTGSLLPFHYDQNLLIFSLVLAFIAAYNVLLITERLRKEWQENKIVWLITGTFSIGIGIFSMHFTAMRAINLPIAISNDITLSLLSMLPALISAALLLFATASQSISRSGLFMTGLGLACSLLLMHHLSMASMQMNANMYYEPFALFSSTLIAMLLAYISVFLARQTIDYLQVREHHSGRAMIALLIALMISGTHYVSMIGISYVAIDAGTIRNELGSWSLLVGVLMLQVMAILFSISVFIGRKNITLDVYPYLDKKEIKQQIYKNTLLVFLPILALVAIVSIMALFVHENIKRSQIMHEVTAQADLIASLVVHDFDAIIEELHFRSEDPLAKEFFIAPTTELKDKLIAELIALAKVKKIFDQVRILSVQGQEKIRIDYNNGKPIAIATERLQDKSQRYYFPDLNKLEQGVVYVSNFDLNIENSHIETPIKPMIRFATPIYDDESGKKLGIVIFNYFGQLIINKIKASIAKKNAKLLLLNSQGSYLIGPTTDKEWGFMFDKNENFKHDFPYAWSTIASNESGHFEVESNLYSFLTVGAVSGKNAGISSQGESERWKVVLYLPTSIWSLFSIFEHLVSLVFVLVLLLIALFIAWSTALNSVYRKLAEKDKQNTLLELNFQKYALDEHAIVSITDANGIITYVNNKFVSISGYARDELLGKTHRVLKSDEHSKAFYQEMWRTIGRGKTWHGEFKNQAKNGCFYWVQSTIVPELDKHGIPCRYISIRTDITAHQLAERELSKLFQAVESSASIVMVTDTKGIIEYINPAFNDITGYTAAEVIGHKTSILQSGDTSEETYKQLWKTINSGQTWRGEFRNRRKDGQYYWASATISPVLENGIVTHFTGIQQDISERKMMENELKRSQTELQANLSILTKSQQQLKEQAEVQMLLRDKAEQADRAKSEFLSSMSHELRTPLNSILGFAQIFEYKSEQALTKTQKICVDNILNGGKHLLNLINEILDLTKIESGNMPISVQNMALYPLVNDCLSFLNSLAQEKSIQISWAENDFLFLHKDFMVSADDTRLKQVILNLLSNAIKYNHAGGQVVLSSQEISSEYLRLIISDNGPGISADKHEIIFHPFTRLEKLNSTVEGTGIGLALSKKMIELMAGKIGLESKPGSGSAFWIDIPKASVSTQQQQVIDQSKQNKASSQHQTELVGTLLYVEDNAASLSLMEQLVEQSPGMLMLSANNAEAGLILAKKHRPNLIILDINLPGMNGLAALAELKKMPETKNIPAIALSASAMPEDVQAGLNAGFKHYLTKPLDLNKMFAIIKSSIKIRQPK